jgi:hypothetical protein
VRMRRRTRPSLSDDRTTTTDAPGLTGADLGTRKEAHKTAGRSDPCDHIGARAPERQRHRWRPVASRGGRRCRSRKRERVVRMRRRTRPNQDDDRTTTTDATGLTGADLGTRKEAHKTAGRSDPCDHIGARAPERQRHRSRPVASRGGRRCRSRGRHGAGDTPPTAGEHLAHARAVMRTCVPTTLRDSRCRYLLPPGDSGYRHL